jgi:hypothetical protein
MSGFVEQRVQVIRILKQWVEVEQLFKRWRRWSWLLSGVEAADNLAEFDRFVEHVVYAEYRSLGHAHIINLKTLLVHQA